MERDRHSAGELWVSLVVFALGAPDGMILCSDTVGACLHRPVQYRPCNFNGALTLTVLVGRAAGRVVIAVRADGPLAPHQVDLDKIATDGTPGEDGMDDDDQPPGVQDLRKR